MNRTPFYLAPEPEPVQSRQEDFDLATMPPGRGDLNYRMPMMLPVNQSFWAVGEYFLVSLAAVPCGILFRDVVGPYLLGFQVLQVVLLVAFLGGLVQFFRPAETAGESSAEARIVTWILVPVLAWATVALASLARDWWGSLLYLAVLPIPLTFFIADQLATHAVWWMSANPRIDLNTMLAWREDWKRRFLDPPRRQPRRKDLPPEVRDLHERVLLTKTTYRFGLPVVAACLVVALAFASIVSPAGKLHEHGFGFFLGFLLGVLVMAFVYTWSFPGAVGICWSFFLAWIYAPPELNPVPWGFRSPVIAASSRRRLVLLCVFLWAMALVMITDHFAWFCFLDPHPKLRPMIIAHGILKDSPSIFLSLAPQHSTALAYIVLAILACGVLPVLVFVLVVFLAAGPVLAGHFFALETSNAYEQR